MRARKVVFREFWGATKRRDLLATLVRSGGEFEAGYTVLEPNAANGYSLRFDVATSTYNSWPTLEDVSAARDWSGVPEKRKGALMAFDAATLRDRIARYCVEVST